MSADLGYVYAVAGMKREANRILNSLMDLSPPQYVSPYDLANVWIGLGEVERAVDCLEIAGDDRSWPLVYLKVDPKLDTLRPHARFVSWLQRMGLTEVAHTAG